jgi:NAD+ kinase
MVRPMPSRLPPPKRLLIVYNPRAERSVALAEAIHAYLNSQPQVLAERAPLDKAGELLERDLFDMLVALGGDGTMLHSGRLTAPLAVPVLGINLGHLGFLTEVQPDVWPEAMGRVLAGDYWIEERMMLRAEHHRDREGQCLGMYEALNEVVAGRGAQARSLRLTTLIDGGEITTYLADGLIVATPTGSTAYALAAGGPILPPELRNILLVAIAPHLSVDRAIVLAHGSTVDIVVHANHEMMLSADGQAVAPLLDGDRIRVRMSEHSACFARVRPVTYFYKTLMARMAQNI